MHLRVQKGCENGGQPCPCALGKQPEQWALYTAVSVAHELTTVSKGEDVGEVPAPAEPQGLCEGVSWVLPSQDHLAVGPLLTTPHLPWMLSSSVPGRAGTEGRLSGRRNVALLGHGVHTSRGGSGWHCRHSLATDLAPLPF